MFQLDVDDLHWLKGMREAADLCAHGYVTVRIDEEEMEFDSTVSAASLYLLRTLTKDHIVEPVQYRRVGDTQLSFRPGERLIPCCGFNMFPSKDLNSVCIIGCGQGLDWTVLHRGDQVALITLSGQETLVPFTQYRREVLVFAAKVERFYRRSTPKCLPEDQTDRDGYRAFWREWRRHRNAAGHI